MSEQDKQNPSVKEALDGSDQVAVRQAKLSGLRESGNDPFSTNWEQSHVSKQAVGLLGENDKQKTKELIKKRSSLGVYPIGLTALVALIFLFAFLVLA